MSTSLRTRSSVHVSVWLTALWVGFIAVHIITAIWGWTEPNQPRGDVYNVYEPWSIKALRGDGIVGVTEPWVYPPLALFPMIFTHLFAPFFGYQWAWVLVMFIANAIGFQILLGRGRSRSRRVAALFWIIFLLALGPIALYRIDSITVPVAVVALLIIRSHPVMAAALLAMSAWVKIWPGALLAAAFASLESKRKYVQGTIAVCIAVIGIVAMGGGLAFLFGFLSMQSSRGLQAESVFATPFLWKVVAGDEGSRIYFDAEIITFQVESDGAKIFADILTPLLLIAAAALMALGLLAHKKGARVRELLPPLALALVLAFIVFNKVGSPQFQTWLIAPLVLWLVWERRRAIPYAAVAVVAALATHMIYPLFYDKFLIADPVMITVITVRNLALIVMMIAATSRVTKLAMRTPTKRT